MILARAMVCLSQKLSWGRTKQSLPLMVAFMISCCWQRNDSARVMPPEHTEDPGMFDFRVLRNTLRNENINQLTKRKS